MRAQDQDLPRVAIVGRPNVGKSTLFNKLVGKRLALVGDEAGITRDRKEAPASLYDLDFLLIDTAGVEEAAPESLSGRMRQQTERALLEADVILFVIDSRSDCTPLDHSCADSIRPLGKPTILIANKAEGKYADFAAFEASRLGFGLPTTISAEHSEGFGDLHERMKSILFRIERRSLEGKEKALRIAFVGRPNVGKSTLINTFVKSDRLLVSDQAGTTRDSISVNYLWRDKPLLLFDTAGMRRRGRIQERLEKLSVNDARKAIDFAESVVVVLDATEEMSMQDVTILDNVVSEGRSVVVALNKWDQVRDKEECFSSFKERLIKTAPEISGVSVVPITGITGEGLDTLMEKVFDSYALWNKRIPTASLNAWLKEALRRHPPPLSGEFRIKIRYATQPKTRPPFIALFGNQLHALPGAYQRYLLNSVRSTFDLPGVPVRFSFRTTLNPYAKTPRNPLTKPTKDLSAKTAQDSSAKPTKDLSAKPARKSSAKPAQKSSATSMRKPSAQKKRF